MSTTTKTALYRRGQLPALPESQVAYLQAELKKLEATSGNHFDKFLIVEKDISGNAAAIELERTVRADETSSLAQQIETITAVGARTSTFAQDSPPASSVEGDLWIDTDDNNKLYRFSSGTGWVAVDDARITANSAAITSEQTARQDADSALASNITTVSAQATRQRITRGTAAPSSPSIGDLWIDTGNANLYKYWDGSAWVVSADLRIAQNAANISSEATARATADSANATRIDTVEANSTSAIASLNATVTDLIESTTDFESSTASRLTNVEVTAGKQRVFRQATTPVAYFVGDLWFDTAHNNQAKVWNGTAWVDTTDARITANTAAITTEQSARVNADTAMATRVDTLTTTVNSNTAAITSEQTARSNADGALSTRIDNLTTTVNGHTTSISTTQSSINGIQARYGVTINNNGYISGISLLSDYNNGNPSSVFRVSADVFAIRTPGAGQDSIYWDGTSLIVRGNILATSVQNGAVSAHATGSANPPQFNIPSTSNNFTGTSTFAAMTCAGGILLCNAALQFVAQVWNASITRVTFVLQPYINGTPQGSSQTFLAHTVASGGGAGRRAEVSIPMLFSAGNKTGSQTVTYSVQVIFTDDNGTLFPCNASSTLTIAQPGYLQEMKA